MEETIKTIPQAKEKLAELMSKDDSPQTRREIHGFLKSLYKDPRADEKLSAWACKRLSEIVLSLMDEPAEGKTDYPSLAEADDLIEAADEARRGGGTMKIAINCLIMDLYNSDDPDRKAYATAKFMSRNEGFIGKIIKKHFPTYQEKYYEELYQEGCVALLEYLPRYNPRVSSTGSTTSYFTYPVIGQMYSWVVENVHNMSPYYAGVVKSTADAIHALKEEGIEDPTSAQIMVQIGGNVAIAQVDTAMAMLDRANVMSLDEDEEVFKKLASGSDPVRETLKQEENDLLLAAVKENLRPTAQACICLKYGVFCEEDAGMSNRAIALKLGLKEGDVSKIISESLKKLKSDIKLSGAIDPDATPPPRREVTRSTEVIDYLFDQRID